MRIQSGQYEHSARMKIAIDVNGNRMREFGFSQETGEAVLKPALDQSDSRIRKSRQFAAECEPVFARLMAKSVVPCFWQPFEGIESVKPGIRTGVDYGPVLQAGAVPNTKFQISDRSVSSSAVDRCIQLHSVWEHGHRR